MMYMVFNPEYSRISDFIADDTQLGQYFSQARNGMTYNLDLVKSSLVCQGIQASIVTFREGNYFMENELVIYDKLRMHYSKVRKHSTICLGGIILDPLLSMNLYSVDDYINDLYAMNKYVSTVITETFIYEGSKVINATLRDLQAYGRLYTMNDVQKEYIWGGQ